MLFAGKWPELERQTVNMREDREGEWKGSEGNGMKIMIWLLYSFKKLKIYYM